MLHYHKGKAESLHYIHVAMRGALLLQHLLAVYLGAKIDEQSASRSLLHHKSNLTEKSTVEMKPAFALYKRLYIAS
jgi:hypothetical protein